MAEGGSLYDEDLIRWSAEQAAALRAAATSGTNLALDWENLAEEIDDLGKSLRRELASRTSTIVEHLLKLECSPAIEPRAGWVETVLRTRDAVDRLLDDAPSLQRDLPAILKREAPKAGRIAAAALTAEGEPSRVVQARIAAGRHTPEQVFGNWFPDAEGSEL